MSKIIRKKRQKDNKEQLPKADIEKVKVENLLIILMKKTSKITLNLAKIK